MKSCENCYWKFNKNIANIWCTCKQSQPEANLCASYDYTCEDCGSSFASFQYEDKKLCSKCMIEALGIEKRVSTSYFLDSKYLGNSRDLGEVIEAAVSCLDLDLDRLLIEEESE